MADVFDPLAQTSNAFNRKAFVGISAGVAAFGGSIAAALAAGEGFGKVHDPIVSETDPAISVEHLKLDRPGGPIDAYAAYPKNATKTTPGVVITMHIWGVDSQMRDTARRFAKEGFVTIVPDLYTRSFPLSGDGKTDYTLFRDNAGKLDDSVVDGDLEAGANWIRARAGASAAGRPPKIGVTGFCMGGSITLRQAVDSKAFDAASVFYGKVRYNTNAVTDGPATDMSLAYADEVHIPLAGNWGARDKSIPAADIPLLRARLKVPNDLKVYDEAGHGFFDDTRDSYVASAASDAWTRTLAWFNKYLKS